MIANGIAILTFIIGFKPLVRWSQSIHSELTKVRRRLEFGPDPETDELLLRIKQLRLTDDKQDIRGRWKITWSDFSGAHEAYCSVSSPALTRKLNLGANQIRDKAIVADLRFFRSDDDQSKPREVEVVKLHYVEGDKFAKLRFDVARFIWRLFPPWDD